MPHAMYRRYCEGFVSVGEAGSLPTLDRIAHGITQGTKDLITPTKPENKTTPTPRKIPRSTPTRSLEHHQLQQQKHDLQLDYINRQLQQHQKTPAIQQDPNTKNKIARLQHRQAYHTQMSQLHSAKVSQMSGLPHTAQPAHPSSASPNLGKTNSAPQPTPKPYSMPVPEHMQGLIKPSAPKPVTSRTMDAEALFEHSIYSKRLLPGESHQEAMQRHHDIAQDHYSALKNMHDQFRRTRGGFLSQGWKTRRRLMKQMKYHKREMDKQVALRQHHFERHQEQQLAAGKMGQRHNLPMPQAPSRPQQQAPQQQSQQQPSEEHEGEDEGSENEPQQTAPAAKPAAAPAKPAHDEEPDDDEVQHPPHGGDLTHENGQFMHSLTPSDAYATAIKYRGTPLGKAHFSGQAFPGSTPEQMANYHKGQARLHYAADKDVGDKMAKEKDGLKKANMQSIRNMHQDRSADHSQFASRFNKMAKQQAAAPAAEPEDDNEGSEQQEAAPPQQQAAPPAAPKPFGKRQGGPEPEEAPQPAAQGPEQKPHAPAPSVSAPKPQTGLNEFQAKGGQFAKLNPRTRFEMAVREPDHPLAQAHFHNRGEVRGVTDNPNYHKEQAKYHQQAGNLHRQNGLNPNLNNASREHQLKKADMHDQLFLHHKNMAAKLGEPPKPAKPKEQKTVPAAPATAE